MEIEGILGFRGRLHVADIGAAAIAETPPYKPLLDRALARLSAVDGDERHVAGIIEAFGPETAALPIVLADGRRHTLYLCAPESGMSSILRPSESGLSFFNGFPEYGVVEEAIEVETKRLADVPELQAIDFLKMDIQGAELMVLENAGDALDQCVAIQLEASFVPLYEDQPSLGDIDAWMRAHGFLPHRFMDVKRWSIAPTMLRKDPRMPFNQLLECDIVYMRALVDLSALTSDQIRKMLLIAGYCYQSPDLMIHCARELIRRGEISNDAETTLSRAYHAEAVRQQAARGDVGMGKAVIRRP